MDIGSYEPAGPEDLVAGETLERRHFDGLVAQRLEVPDLQLFECLFSDSQIDECVLARLRSTGTIVMGSSIARLDIPGATMYAGGLEGARIGALTTERADLSVVRIVSSRIDVLSIRDSRMRHVEITDSRIGVLDLTGTRVREVTIRGGSVDELIPSRDRVDDFDVSGTELGSVADPRGLGGTVLSVDQAMMLGPALARQLGATVADAKVTE